MSERSNYHYGKKRSTCYFCSASGDIEEHHIIPQRFGGPDEQSNISGVCKSCHGKLERLYDKSFYEWFGITDEKGERLLHVQCRHKGCENKAVRVMDWADGVPVCDPCAYENAKAQTKDYSGMRTITPELSFEQRVQRNLEESTREFSAECEPYWSDDDE